MRRWIPLWTIPLMIVMAIGTVWLRLSIVGTTYAIDQADRTIRELQQEREQSELKVTSLRSPRRLELIAKTKFGLAQPKSEQLIHMGGEKQESRVLGQTQVSTIKVSQAAPKRDVSVVTRHKKAVVKKTLPSGANSMPRSRQNDRKDTP